MSRGRVTLVLLATVMAIGTFATSAYAKPGYASACSSCHAGSNLPVSTTLVSNAAGASTFSYSSPGADAVAVFAGASKQTVLSTSSGSFTVANGQTYTLYAVAGPGTNSGLGSATVSPANPAPTPTSPPVDPAPGDGFTSVAGATRYETAVQASQRAFPVGADSVVIATGVNWPDALGGGALAAAVGGPILLSSPSALPFPVTAEVLRLGAGHAYILGGTAAISTDVENSLRSLLGAANVTRIAGSTRYETAEEIARAVAAKTAGSGTFDGGAFLATGANFPDALAASPLAVSTGRPIFLAGPGGVSASTRAAMQACGVDEVVVLGGTGAISVSIENDLIARFGTSNVRRLAGANRYATAVEVATYGVESLGLSWDGLAIATGTGFPDALAGGVMQGLAGSVLLLTPGDGLDSSTGACISANRAAITDMVFLGGTGAVSQAVRTQIRAVLDAASPPPDGGGPTPDPVPDPSTPHAALTWANYPSNCLSCHPDEFGDAYQGVHYQWQGEAPENVNQSGVLQGKLTNAINSYCVSVGDNWQLCGKCHAGRGDVPVWTETPSTDQLLNVDCLVCHNESYTAVRTRLADGSLGPSTTDRAVLDSYVRNISEPTRANCLTCHAYAGGGDAVKRGDLSWATANTTDRSYDVHMATTGADLVCQSCHEWSQHKVTGRGSDLRVTDNPGEVTCSTATCHPDNNQAQHSSAVQSHVARVACQTCHIPAYGRNAADSVATEATEIDRNWLVTNVAGAKPWHPGSTKANDVTPVYEWWNGTSDSMLLGDANLTPEADGTYATSRPVGSANETGAKLYPFKYKTATQPMRAANRMLVGIDTFDYMMGSGSPYTATRLGLAQMGFASGDTVEWVRTSTYQALNHSVPPSENALQCADCHDSTTRIDLKADLGYALKGAQSAVCTQCHGSKDALSFTKVHEKHSRYDCSFCHTFSRPERGLRTTR